MLVHESRGQIFAEAQEGLGLMHVNGCGTKQDAKEPEHGGSLRHLSKELKMCVWLVLHLPAVPQHLLLSLSLVAIPISVINGLISEPRAQFANHVAYASGWV